MSTADEIRLLAREGLAVAEIARELGIRYQHAYGVLKRSGLLPNAGLAKSESDGARAVRRAPPGKPPLSTAELVNAGFQLSGRWMLSNSGDLTIDRPMLKEPGVYAFAKEAAVLYVGVATMGLAKRLYFYGKPGVTQRTSQRLNGILMAELQSVRFIEIYTAVPPDLEWNGLPVHGCAGLELGLIKKYELPWNKRSAG